MGQFNEIISGYESRYTVHLGRGIYQLIDADPYPQNLRSRKKITKMSNPEPIPSSTVHTNYTYINTEQLFLQETNKAF